MGNSTSLPVCAMFMNETIEVRHSGNDEATTAMPFLSADPTNHMLNHTTKNLSVGTLSAGHGGVTISWIEIHVVISILCLLGIVGNILNLLVLNNRRMSSDRIGRSMNVGLISLAISDMLFCLVVVPYTFVPKDMEPTPADAAIFKLIYRLYGTACINMFMMSSTWIVMFMSISRYLGIVYPLKAQSSIYTQQNGDHCAMCVCNFYASYFTILHPLSVLPCTDGYNTLYELRPMFSDDTEAKLVYYIRWVWPVIADFLPLLLLVFCNTRLILELHKTSKSCKETCLGQPVRATSNRVTITLISVVLMLFIFVSPSEILKYIDPYKAWGKAGHVIAMVTNIMQLVNFSSNFLLYCAINPKFREAAKGLVLDLCCPWKTKHRLVSDQNSKTTAGYWKSTYSARSTATGPLASYHQVSTSAISSM